MATLDTLQAEVNTLTTATTSILSEVQTKKAVLDAAAADAVAASGTAATSAANALASKDSAAISATLAANTATALTGFDLAAIAETKGVTAVDVFVYDTSKDSDGGAWRKRTQGTSWYNETLNTATRGARREFPSVAVIVLEAGVITIYDGDDPSLPMWGVWDNDGVEDTVGGAWWYVSVGASTVTALNGQIMFGEAGGSSTRAGAIYINLLRDVVGRYGNITAKHIEGLDASTGSKAGDLIESVTDAILVNSYVKDVAMTVLPDAPIDAATGLPVPTIAVATAGGVSVITDSGAVYDITNASSSYTNVFHVDFDSLNNLWLNQGNTSLSYNSWVYVFAMPLSADTAITLNSQTATGANPIAMFQRSVANGASIPFDVQGGDSLIAESSLATSGGLGILSVDYSDSTKSMGAEITSTYNTGWQQGDIKGAFLSSTDTTSLVGSGELVTNGDFGTGTTGWTPKNANTTLSVVGNQLSVATDGETGYAYQAITTVAGQTYRLTADADETTGASYASIFVGATVGSSSLGSHTVSGIDTGLSITFVATSTTTYITLYNTRTTPASYALFDNISVVAAGADRSVNNNGLVINGTITKTPVATGADLVAYSGFSASNYLEQPYNSDLDFGTGDFCIMGWVQESAASDWIVDRMEGRDGSSNIWGFNVWQSSQSLRFAVSENGASTSVTATTVMGNGDGVWHFFTAVRRSGVLEMYMQGNLEATTSGTVRNISYTSTGNPPPLTIGASNAHSAPWLYGSAALLRISATAPSAEQIAKIYNDEKFLFQENAQATLYGSSDAVTALAHDSDTDLLHVGTSAGRSVFQGLRRVSNTTTAVGTAISASNNLIVEE